MNVLAIKRFLVLFSLAVVHCLLIVVFPFVAGLTIFIDFLLYYIVLKKLKNYPYCSEITLEELLRVPMILFSMGNAFAVPVVFLFLAIAFTGNGVDSNIPIGMLSQILIFLLTIGIIICCTALFYAPIVIAFLLIHRTPFQFQIKKHAVFFIIPLTAQLLWNVVYVLIFFT